MAQAGIRKPHIVDATILFIDLMDSVALSNSLTLIEYNHLINDYQAMLRRVIDVIRKDYPVAELYLGGDQLAAFFYDPADAGLREKAHQLRARSPASRLAPQIEARLDHTRQRCLYGALRCSVQVKNAWIGDPRNVERIAAQQPVLDIGAGINSGNVIFQQRADGECRIEGFAINFAKRVESFSRSGSFCKIMLSKTAFEVFSNTVVGHSMLKQRAAFEPYTPEPGVLKGLAAGTQVFELKWFHRLAGFAITADHVPLYRQVFFADPTNIWAYTNLLNYHLYSRGDVDEASLLAHRALYSNPRNEKVHYDLAEISFRKGEYDAAREYCQRCVRLNDQMDIAYDMLADLEARSGRAEELLHYRAKALAITPGSAEYHLDMAIALAGAGRREDACRHLSRSRDIFPGIDDLRPDDVATLECGLGQRRRKPKTAAGKKGAATPGPSKARRAPTPPSAAG